MELIEFILNQFQQVGGETTIGGAIATTLATIYWPIIILITITGMVSEYPNKERMFIIFLAIIASPILAAIASVLTMVFAIPAIAYLLIWISTKFAKSKNSNDESVSSM